MRPPVRLRQAQADCLRCRASYAAAVVLASLSHCCLFTACEPERPSACPCSLPKPLIGSVSLRLSCCKWAEQRLARRTALHLPSMLLPSIQGSNKPAQMVAQPVAVSAHAASLGPLQGSYSLAGHERRDTVFVRGYVNGKLEREEVVTAEERDAVFGPLEKRQERKNRRRHRTARVRHAGHLVDRIAGFWYICHSVKVHELPTAESLLASHSFTISHSIYEPSYWFPGQRALVQSPAEMKDLILVLHTLAQSPNCIIRFFCVASGKNIMQTLLSSDAPGAEGAV